MKQKNKKLSTLLALFATSLMQPVISSVAKVISWKWVRRAGRAYID